MELPEVVLGGEEAREKPQTRLLPGRVEVNWTLYPCYLLVLVSGSLVVNYSIDTGEWALGMVVAAWVLLFIWNWVYGVAYRYRRALIKYFSFLMAVVMGLGLAALSWEKGQPQLVAIAGELVARGEVTRLVWACWMMVVNPALLVFHMVFLGRGYRVKRLRVKSVDQAKTA